MLGERRPRAPAWGPDTHYDAGWSSPVARQAHNLKVTGSNPVPATSLAGPRQTPTRTHHGTVSDAGALCRPTSPATARNASKYGNMISSAPGTATGLRPMRIKFSGWTMVYRQHRPPCRPSIAALAPEWRGIGWHRGPARGPAMTEKAARRTHLAPMGPSPAITRECPLWDKQSAAWYKSVRSMPMLPRLVSVPVGAATSKPRPASCTATTPRHRSPRITTAGPAVAGPVRSSRGRVGVQVRADPCRMPPRPATPATRSGRMRMDPWPTSTSDPPRP